MQNHIKSQTSVNRGVHLRKSQIGLLPTLDYRICLWNIKKKLSNKISNKSIDDAYYLAKKNGAYGGKLSGAGGGGFLNLVTKKKLRDSLIKPLSRKKFKYFPLELDSTGSTIISK